MSGSLQEQLALLPTDQRSEALAVLSPKEQEEMLFAWRGYRARPNQLPPGTPGSANSRTDWRYWLLKAGRGFGKTRTGAETVREWESQGKRIIHLVGATTADVRNVMIEGPGGLLQCYPEDQRPYYEPSKRMVTWSSGAVAHTFSAEEPERLRGPQCLSGDSLIAMGNGTQKEIRLVRVGEFVLTRRGVRRVEASAMTKRDAWVLSLKLLDGRSIIGTEQHPVWVEGAGFVELSKVTPGQKVCVIGVLGGAGNYGISERRGITKPTSGCIEKSGSRSKDQSLKVSTFITSTKTRPTTISTIWNYFRKESIAGDISGIILKIAKSVGKWLLQTAYVETTPNASSDTWPALSAEEPFTAVQSIRRDSVRRHVLTGRVRDLRLGRRIDFASTAARGTGQQNERNDIVASDAITLRPKRETGSESLELSPVPNVERASRVSDQMPDSVHVSVPLCFMESVVNVERLSVRMPVYDLTIQGEHEFFANGILVHNCECVWGDELAAWGPAGSTRGIDTWDNMAFGLRLGSDPRGVFTSTPKPVKLFRQVATHPKTVMTGGSTYENRAHLAAGFFEDIITRYEGTRLGRQELLAELLEDIPGALWTRQNIGQYRVELSKVPQLIRAVVAIDPAVTANEDSDETGIGVVGLGVDGHLYVLEDASLRASPGTWARRAVQLFVKWREADKIIAEVNNGGDLVEANIRMVHPDIPYRAVRATKGKMTRAEPVAALYEQGKVHHVGQFELLEDQLVTYVPGVTEKSPDRMDWLVWACYDLKVDPMESAILTAMPGRRISQY